MPDTTTINTDGSATRASAHNSEETQLSQADVIPGRLNVLNPNGRDPHQAFLDGPADPGDSGHAPINFHAYAACTNGVFAKNAADVMKPGEPVLVLLRRRLAPSLVAVQALKAAGQPVFVSWKETGLLQVTDQLSSPRVWRVFREICQLADGAISAVPGLVGLYEAASNGEKPVMLIPTPYPVDFPQWDFSRELNEREGIFIGTRHFGTTSRCHLLALNWAKDVAGKTGCGVTVINTEGRSGERWLQSLEFDPGVLRISTPRAYPDYLSLMAGHRIVLQADQSAVPGQVAGDALLCRMPCLGGNGAIDEIAFPMLRPTTSGGPTLGELAESLLMDDSFWLDTVSRSQEIATRKLSFASVAKMLRNFCFDHV